MKKIGKKFWLMAFSAVAVMALIVSVGVPAVAAWVNEIQTRAEVKSPTKLSLKADTPVIAPVFPGQKFTVDGVNENAAPVEYGIFYYAGVFYEWDEYMEKGSPLMSSAGTKVVKSENMDLTTNSAATKAKAAVTGAKPTAGTTAGIGWYYTNIADITLFVDPDGSGPLPAKEYLTGQKINLAPNGVHFVTAEVRVRHAAYPGTIRLYVSQERVEPN